MRKPTRSLAPRHKQFPVFVERDEDGIYVVEYPVLEGCYSQGKKLDEALHNIREAIILAIKDRPVRETLRSYYPTELSLHTITI